MATITLSAFRKKLGASPFKGYTIVGGTYIASLDYTFEVSEGIEFRNIGTVELRYQSGKVIITGLKHLFVTPADFIIEDDMIGIGPALTAIKAAIGSPVVIDVLIKPTVGFIIEDDLIGI